MKNINLGRLSIPVTQYASQGNAVLGIRDSGKSYSATYLAEQLYGASVPFVAFDPSGVWKFLRVPGKGPGLPVVVAGGKAPDLPLTPQSAPEIVRAAMKSNVSLVLDLYDIHMSKADWSRIVESCVRVLLYENGEHGLRHIFIEEAAEFAPQQIAGDKAKVYAEIEKLARIGGNALLGYTLINQRAEQVNKAVLELCDCLFLHRQKGKNSIKSLEKWLELSQGSDVKEIVRGLPTLPSGECWAWPAGAEHAMHVKMPQKNTFHPDRRALIANPAAANVQRVDATAFVAELRRSLEKYIEEAKANDPAELRKRVKELERQLAAKPDVGIDAKELSERQREARAEGFHDGYNTAKRERFAELRGALVDRLNRARGDVDARLTELQDELRHERDSGQGFQETDARPEVPVPAPTRSSISDQFANSRKFASPVSKQIDARAPANERQASGSELPKGERIVLTAIAQFGDRGVESDQLFVLTGYKSRSITEYISRLRAKMYVNAHWPAVATPAGIAALGPSFEPLPRGKALVEHWYARLPAGELKVLRQVIDHHPVGLSNERIGELTDYASRSVTEYVSRLKARRLVERRSGQVHASEDLFS